nr:hypothetical protein [Tanacetum cinerariifolium]
MTRASGSLGTPSTVEKSPLDFLNEDPPLLITESIRAEEQGQDELSQGAASVRNPPYTGVAPEPDMKKETVDTGALVSKRRRKRGPDEAEVNAPPKVPRKDYVASQPSQKGVSGLDSLSYAKPRPTPEQDVAQSSRKAVVTEYPDSEKSTSFTSMVGSPGSIYQPREKHIRNVEALLEAEVDMKGAAEAKNVELAKELESLRVQFSNLQLSNNQLSQEVSTLQAQIIGEERIKTAFEEFKKYEDDRVSSRCAKIDTRLDALSIDFDEELYPNMLTAIAGHRWIIRHGLRLAVMKCAESTELRQVFADVVSAGIDKGMSEGLKHMVEHGKAMVDLAAIEAYDSEADTKYVEALYALKDLKYPLVNQMEKLNDAPIDVIMASLFLESDSGEDAPQWIRELRPSSSQLKILVYPEVRNPKDPWLFKDEILLEDAIAANVSRAEKKKKCRMLAYAATQTEVIEDEASPRLIRSKSLQPLYDLDWP